MADKNDAPLYPTIFVTDVGAPEGSVYVHDQATGMTVTADASPQGYNQAISDLNKFAK
jgi:hypothetical protein